MRRGFIASIVICLSTLGTSGALADKCQRGIAFGFETFSLSDFDCETETDNLKTCYSAKASDSKFWYSGTMCILSNNVVWRPSGRSYDFKVGRYKITPSTEKDGVNCFAASAIASTTARNFYFCDLTKIGDSNKFTRSEVRQIMATKETYR